MHIPNTVSFYQRDLRDIQHTLNRLVADMGRARSRRQRHTAALLAAVSYKLSYWEQTARR